MYVYLNTMIVEESNVHANKASQSIEKEERTPLLSLALQRIEKRIRNSHTRLAIRICCSS